MTAITEYLPGSTPNAPSKLITAAIMLASAMVCVALIVATLRYLYGTVCNREYDGPRNTAADKAISSLNIMAIHYKPYSGAFFHGHDPSCNAHILNGIGDILSNTKLTPKQIETAKLVMQRAVDNMADRG